MSPLLLVSNLDESITFYTKLLGFEISFRYEDFYCGIVRNRQSIHLKYSDQPNTKSHSENPDIVFSVDLIDELYHEFNNKAIKIIQPLHHMPYGREFYIADPDGNKLAFVEEKENE